jgi:general secretion pathway protein B
MSFILDALKKSENERQRSTGPGIYELKVAQPRARFPLWAVIIATLLGVNVLVGIWYLMRNDAPTPLAADNPEAAPAAQQTIARAPETAPVLPPAPVAPAVGNAPAGGETRTDLERGIFNPADFEPAAEPGETPGAASPAAESSRATVQRRPAVAGLPSRDDLTLEGSAVPEVSMSLHVYDPNPASRFAFINGRRAQEGDVLPNGLRVESITPEGAVLDWQGRRFLLALP